MLKDVLERAALELHDVEGKVEALVSQIGDASAIKQLIETVQADVESLKTGFSSFSDRLLAIEASLQAAEGAFSAPVAAAPVSVPAPASPDAPSEPPATAAAPSAS